MKTTLNPKSVLALLAASLPMLASAANLTWDANTATTGAQDGSGTWDTTANNWWTGAANATWANATPDAPFFGSGGTAGTVTLGANIVSGNITFNAGGVGNYTIAGGGFQLSLTNRTITPNVSATISANLNGGSLTVPNSAANSPSGTLTLSGNNSTTNFSLGSSAPNTTASVRINSSTALGVASGTIGIAGGQGNQTSHRIEVAGSGLTVAQSIPSNLGRNNNSPFIVNLGTGNIWSGRLTRSTGGQDAAIQSEVANGITFNGANGGGIALSSQAGAPRNFVLRGTGGGTISGVISNGSAANNLGIVKYGSGTWTFSGANTYTNGTIVNEGTLTLDYSSQDNSKLPDQGPLTLGGGTVNLSGGTHTEINFSTTILGGHSRVTRSSGSATLRLNSLSRSRGGVIDFGAASIADTDTLNVNGILGGYATVAGADWAINSAGAGDGAITAYSAYTDIAATGSTIADGAATNVRLNSAGGGGNIALGATTTTINTLLQNTTTAATVDTASKTLRLGATGGVLLPASAQSLTVGTAVDSGALTAGGADNTAGEIILINNSANAATINSTITDNGTGIVSFTKAGSGTATLAGNNTHTGTNTIAGGTLNFSSDANFGAVPGSVVVSSILINGGKLNATADVTVSANRSIALGPTSRYGNGTIGVDAAKTLTIPGVIANADVTGNGPGASLTKTGAGTLVLAGANTYSSGTIINEGTVSVTADNNLGVFFQPPGCYMPDNLVLNGGTLQVTAGFTMSANRGVRLGPVGGSGTGTFNIDASQTLTFNGQISDNWNGTGSFAKSGDGNLTLTGSVSDYSGDTTVSAGTLQLNNSRALPNGAGKGNVTVNTGATLAINGVNVGVNGLSGSGTVDNITGTAMTLSVGNNDQTSSFSGTINNTGGGPLALAKDGSGTLTLNNATASHTGSTLVRNSTLTLTGSTTIGSTTNIVVSSGATLSVSGLTGGTLVLASGQTLSGVGSVTGNIDTGVGAIAPGTSAGTLPITGSLTLGSGSALNYELANVTTVGSSVNDLITVSGNLTVAGPVTLNLTYLNALPASSGTYTLITYGGSFAGNVNDISVPSGFTINHNVGAKRIELQVNHIPQTLTWRGDGAANVWDINTTANWVLGATPTNFFNGDSAVFNDSGSNTPAIFIAAPIIASAINVNAAQSYTFSGSDLASGSLTKSGAGTLTLETTATTPGATISAGAVQVGNAGTSGFLGGGNITNNGALVFNRTDGITVTNEISGTGSLAQNGTGDVGLSASNSYAGLTTVAAGRLFVINGSSLGSTASGTVVNDGAELFITQNVNVDNESLTLTGAGSGGIGGALHKGGAGVTTYGGSVSLLGDTMFNIDGGATLNLTNTAGVNGIAANANLQLAGSGAGNIAGPILLGAGTVTNSGGVWTVSASNNYAGNTVISGGRYHIASPKSLGVQPGVWTPDRVLLAGGGLGVTNDVNVSLNDGRIGIMLSALEGQLAVNAGATLTVSNEISGAGNLVKLFPGTLILSGSNSYTGALYLDRGADGNNYDGITRLTTTNALANVTEIRSRNTSVNTAGGATLQLDGTAGNLNITQPVFFSCRQDPATNTSIQSMVGSNTLSGGLSLLAGGNWVHVQSDAGAKLAITANIQYVDTLLALRNLHFRGDGDTLVTGDILLSANLTTPLTVIKSGTGTLTLAGANTYSDITVVSNGVLHLSGSINSTGAVMVAGGTLAGNGTISANAGVNVLAGGTLSPGASIGTLTLNNNNLTLAGTTRVELNKTANTADLVTGINVASYGGTLVVTNISGTLSIGDTFQLFNAAFNGGNFSSIINNTTQGDIGFSFNPATGVLTVTAGVPTTPRPFLTNSFSGNSVTFSWPASHIGYILQSQTNSLNVGIVNSNNQWFDWPGTASVTTTNIPLNPNNPTVFFRLRHPFYYIP